MRSGFLYGESAGVPWMIITVVSARSPLSLPLADNGTRTDNIPDQVGRHLGRGVGGLCRHGG